MTDDSSAGPAPTILVVEDDPDVRQFLRFALERTGYRVLAAGGVREALPLVDRSAGTPVDLLLTDVILPDGDGGSLARAAQARHPGLPAVFISGHTPSGVFRRADLNAALVLQKPFAVNALLSRIRDALARSA